jgi:hypothetical protein
MQLLPLLENAPLLDECYVLLNASKISKRLYKIRTMKIYLLSSQMNMNGRIK